MTRGCGVQSHRCVQYKSACNTQQASLDHAGSRPGHQLEVPHKNADPLNPLSSAGRRCLFAVIFTSSSSSSSSRRLLDPPVHKLAEGDELVAVRVQHLHARLHLGSRQVGCIAGAVGRNVRWSGGEKWACRLLQPGVSMPALTLAAQERSSMASAAHNKGVGWGGHDSETCRPGW